MRQAMHGMYGGQENLAETLATPRPLQRRYSLPETADRLTIVALGLRCYAEILVRQRVQDNIPDGRGKRQGTLSGSAGLVMHTHEVEMIR
jgi:hypothetical protein